MTALDTRFRALALKVLTEKGKTVTLTTLALGTYDTATSSATNTATSASVKALISEYSAGQIFASGGNIIAGDKKFLIAAQGTTKPKPGDSITLNSELWSVAAAKEIWGGEEVIMYEIQARS